MSTPPIPPSSANPLLQSIETSLSTIRQDVVYQGENTAAEGDFKGQKITHVSGLLFRLETMEQKLENLKNLPESIHKETQLKTLNNDIKLLQNKLEKVIKVRNAVYAKFKEIGQDAENWNEVTVKSDSVNKTHTYKVIREKEGITIVSNKLITKLNHLLGDGSYGVVYGHQKDVKPKDTSKTENTPAVGAVGKYTINTSEERAYAGQQLQLSNELKVLRDLQKEGPIEGIMPTPKALVQVNTGNGLKKVLIGSRFTDDVQNVKGNLDSNTIKTGFSKLFHALSTMHNQGYVHRDIKTDNLGYHKENTNAPLCLIDFGKAKKLDRDMNERQFGQVVSIGAYTPKDLNDMMVKLIDTKTIEGKEKYIECAKKADWSALGKSLIETLLPERRFSYIETHIFDFKEGDDGLKPLNEANLMNELKKVGKEEYFDLIVSIFEACKVDSLPISKAKIEEWMQKINEVKITPTPSPLLGRVKAEIFGTLKKTATSIQGWFKEKWAALANTINQIQISYLMSGEWFNTFYNALEKDGIKNENFKNKDLGIISVDKNGETVREERTDGLNKNYVIHYHPIIFDPEPMTSRLFDVHYIAADQKLQHVRATFDLAKEEIKFPTSNPEPLIFKSVEEMITHLKEITTPKETNT